MNLGSGGHETFTYNDRFQMTSQSLMKGSLVQQKYDYSFGTVDLTDGTVDATKNNGQLSKVESYIGTDKQWSQRFGYDHLGRLKESREYRGDNNSLTYKQVFDFDRFGNMYRKSANNGTGGQANPLPYTPIEDSDMSKTTNRFTTGTTYNEAGMVVNDTKFRNMGFGYDANGRMVRATKANTPDAATVYDALGNRVATKVDDTWQVMVYDAFGKLVAEYGEPQEVVGSRLKYVQQDWQGSVRTVSNQNGYVISRTDHTAYGENIGAGIGLRTTLKGYFDSPDTRQGYGLTERDEATGLDHTWFRKNENRSGRWTSPDPYLGSMSIGDPQSFNRYSYVSGDPVNFVDPSGLFMEIVCAPDRWDPVTATVYAGACYVISTGGNVGNGWTPMPIIGPPVGTSSGGSGGYTNASSENSNSDCDVEYNGELFRLQGIVNSLYGNGGGFILISTGESGRITRPVSGLVDRVLEEMYRFVVDVLKGPIDNPRHSRIEQNTVGAAIFISSVYGNDRHQFGGFLKDRKNGPTSFFHNPNAMRSALEDIFRRAIDAAQKYLACKNPQIAV